MQPFWPARSGSAALPGPRTGDFIKVSRLQADGMMTKTYFITASAYMHQNLFQRTEITDLLLATLFRYRDAGEFTVHEFVVMPNHIHLLISVDDDHAVGRAIQMVKGGFSHAVGQAGLKLKAVWQTSYYEHRVRDEDEYERMRNSHSPESSTAGPVG